MRAGYLAVVLFLSCSAAVAMGSWLHCVVTSTACMTMMDGSVGYCYEETCSAVLFPYQDY